MYTVTQAVKTEEVTPLIKDTPPSKDTSIKPSHVGPVEQDHSVKGPQGAPVGNRVTTGWSDPFGGTSWGIKK